MIIIHYNIMYRLLLYAGLAKTLNYKPTQIYKHVSSKLQAILCDLIIHDTSLKKYAPLGLININRFVRSYYTTLHY